MRSEAVRKTEAEVSAKVLPINERDEGFGPLAVLTLVSAALLCFLLV